MVWWRTRRWDTEGTSATEPPPGPEEGGEGSFDGRDECLWGSRGVDQETTRSKFRDSDGTRGELQEGGVRTPPEYQKRGD